MLICWTSADGEEHDEEWESIDAFRCWAVSEGIRCRYRVYEHDDEDDEAVLVDSGRVGP